MWAHFCAIQFSAKHRDHQDLFRERQNGQLLGIQKIHQFKRLVLSSRITLRNVIDMRF